MLLTCVVRCILCGYHNTESPMSDAVVSPELNDHVTSSRNDIFMVGLVVVVGQEVRANVVTIVKTHPVTRGTTFQLDIIFSAISKQK